MGPKSGNTNADKGNVSFAKWGNLNPVGKAPMADPGGKVYQDSDWVLKTNEGSLAKNMPLLIQFTRYGDGDRSKKMGKEVI